MSSEKFKGAVPAGGPDSASVNIGSIPSILVQSSCLNAEALVQGELHEQDPDGVWFEHALSWVSECECCCRRCGCSFSGTGFSFLWAVPKVERAALLKVWILLVAGSRSVAGFRLRRPHSVFQPRCYDRMSCADGGNVTLHPNFEGGAFGGPSQPEGGDL
jgi:hypothetical protein